MVKIIKVTEINTQELCSKLCSGEAILFYEAPIVHKMNIYNPSILSRSYVPCLMYVTREGTSSYRLRREFNNSANLVGSYISSDMCYPMIESRNSHMISLMEYLSTLHLTYTSMQVEEKQFSNMSTTLYNVVSAATSNRKSKVDLPLLKEVLWINEETVINYRASKVNIII